MYEGIAEIVFAPRNVNMQIIRVCADDLEVTSYERLIRRRCDNIFIIDLFIRLTKTEQKKKKTFNANKAWSIENVGHTKTKRHGTPGEKKRVCTYANFM